MNIIACEAPSGRAVDAAPLAWAFSRMTPGLWAPGLLEGETFGDAAARHMAAADILDDLLAEYEPEDVAEVAEAAALGGGW